MHCSTYVLIGYLCVCVCLCPPRLTPAPYWNETAGKKLGVLADENNTLQQNSSSNSSSSHAMQKEITLPSRLIYYINQDSESPYHVLDTKARHQQKHNKVGRGWVCKSGCCEELSLDLIFCQNLILQILLQHFIRKPINGRGEAEGNSPGIYLDGVAVSLSFLTLNWNWNFLKAI